MAAAMTSPASPGTRDGEVEGRWARDLAAADRALADVHPLLRHALGKADAALLNDRIVARVRAQLEDLAERLAHGEGSETRDALAEALIADPALLRHAHALAVEAQLAAGLAEQVSLDPVLSPLLQMLIASADPAATELVAAQARFVQAQQRGELSPADLPREGLEAALRVLRDQGLEASPQAIGSGAEDKSNRLALLDRVVAALAEGSTALDVTHAGVALFASALARASGLDRADVILATAETQLPRLALALRASGAAVERQVFALHPDAALPEGLGSLDAKDAAALLARRSAK